METPVDNDQRRAALERDGFFVWPNLVPAELIDRHLAAYEAWLEERGTNSPAEWQALSRRAQITIFYRDYLWHLHADAAQELYWQPALIDFLRQQFGSEPVMRAPQSGLKTRRTSTHVDGLGMQADPPSGEVRVWYALEDIQPEAGPVYFYPGSHRLIVAGAYDQVLAEQPELRGVLERLEQLDTRPDQPYPGADLLRATNALIERRVQELRLPRVVPTLQKGDAAVFRTDLAHGTMPCADESLTRKHALCFFSGEHVGYYNESAFWGSGWDRRSPERRIQWTLGRLPRGLYAESWLEELRASSD